MSRTLGLSQLAMEKKPTILFYLFGALGTKPNIDIPSKILYYQYMNKFRLPSDITVSKARVQGQWVYTFRHREIGELGRIRLKEVNGRTWINCETVGDQDDPMTAKRQAIFEPVGKGLAEEMERILGKSVDDGSSPPPPPIEKALVESKMMQCVRCGAFVAMLIYADDARTPDRLEDYARLMYPTYSRVNLPTWVIGTPLNTPESPAYILKVWPEREPVQLLRPGEFNAGLDRIQESHCR